MNANALPPCVDCKQPKDTIFSLRCSRCGSLRKMDLTRKRRAKEKVARATIIRIVFTEEESRAIHVRSEQTGVDPRLLVKALVLRDLACLPK